MAPRTKPGSRSGSSSHSSRPAASQKGAPNTRRHVYIDTAAAKGNCAKDVGAIEKKCAPETPTEKQSRQKSAPGPLGKLKLPTHSGKAANPDAQWINDHCEFLMIKPSSPEEMFKELENIPAQMADELGTKALEAVEAKAKEKLESAVKAKLAKMAIKQGLVRGGSFLGGPWTGAAVNALMTADGALDAAAAAEEFPELKREVEQAAAKIKDAKAQISDIQGQLDKYKNPDGSYNKQKMVTDMMTGAAKLNPCIRARRCALVPYRETLNPLSGRDGKGCCPGQSGHHVLPSAMFEGCPGYSEGDAPTICVEGTNNRHGSHGTIHAKLMKELDDLDYATGKIIPRGAQITKEGVINAGVRSVASAFPESGCDDRCIKSQLHAFYDRLNCTPVSHPGVAAPGKDKRVGQGSAD
ncbi:HNH/endonuclease VII fold toxin-2 domain-containing protein [Paracidovorax oryzae]|uniref:HNH/endonuclease VII fold toxin-2 domain-containing protein n=1 Tax=Paracidovorax oryzae TaxID=862720 RepID=UPI0009FEF255|nr:HNH/endonuclease VII fold toxin-2 domain-containing protein [Paracidovorax oryzae]